MQATATERARSMFEAFLRHARGGAEAPAERRVLPPRPQPRPLPPGYGLPQATDDPPSDSLDSEVTRVVSTPVRPAISTELPAWDDRTEESEGPSAVMRTLDESNESTDLAVKLPETQVRAPPVDERSIIIDDDSLTVPEQPRDPTGSVPVQPLPSAQSALDLLLLEMAVLVKYGHAEQASHELDLWSAAHPDELVAQMRLAEFEMSRIDRERALQRYGTLLSLFLDRGDARSANDVLRRLRRDMPGDPRVTAIAQWNGM